MPNVTVTKMLIFFMCLFELSSLICLQLQSYHFFLIFEKLTFAFINLRPLLLLARICNIPVPHYS